MSAEPGVIEGVVEDSNEVGVQGAIVVAKRQEDNETFETTTDASGFFRFDNLARGEYHVMARYDDGTEQFNSLSKPYLTVQSDRPISGVSHWDFEDDTDTTTAIDVWGENDGTIDGATYISDGIYGNALRFTLGDRVVVGTGERLEEGETFSISCWIRTTNDVNANNRPIVKQLPSGSFNGWWLTFGNNSEARFGVNTQNDQVDVTGTTSINDGSWHHVVGVYDISGQQQLYVDGTEEGSVSSSGETVSTEASLTFGQRQDGIAEYPGDLDEPKFFDKALSASEVSDLNTNGQI